MRANRTTEYLQRNSLRLVALAGLLMCSALGVLDPSAAFAVMVVGDVEPATVKELHAAMQKVFTNVQENIKKTTELAEKALEEVKQEGTLHGKTNEKLTELGTQGVKLGEQMAEHRARLLDLEQKIAKKHATDDSDGKAEKSAGQMLAESEELKEFIKTKAKNSNSIEISRKAILTTTFNNQQPLVPVYHRPGIVAAPERRLTVRDLLPQLPTQGNVIQYTRELVFTNAAAPQYDASSPDPHAEGAQKAESNITFELANAVVVTLAHFIAASRQILDDAPQLAAYIDARLMYGLKLEEEDELLNSSGSAGELDGLRNQATAFNAGVTNATALDTILRAFNQVALAEYEASGLVLHPTDWMNILLLKDTTGRYLFSDPHSVEQPRVWGKPVVPTQAMTQGQFLAGAFNIAAAIYDREGVNIRVSTEHADFFIKNLVAILCEERLALAVFRPQAFVTGALSYAG